MNLDQYFEEAEAQVEINDLSVSFGKNQILRNIDLKILAGQTVALLGESGCGKTVLMKTIIALKPPSNDYRMTGSVVFDGKDLAKLRSSELARLRLRFGFLFQNAALFDSMTIEQNVAFPLRQHGRFQPSEVREMVLQRLAEVGLPDNVVHKRPAELSGGMQKRVGLARALIMNPELIMYDEPTTGLDPIMSDVINELILRTRRRNPVTSIVVTHDMHTARKVADRVIMLYPLTRLDPHEPQVIYDGPPEGLETSRDRRVRQFVNGEAGQRLMELRANGV